MNGLWLRIQKYVVVEHWRELITLEAGMDMEQRFSDTGAGPCKLELPSATV